MAPLKSVEKDFPIIDYNFQQFCASHGIFSVEDFLVHDLDALMNLAEKNSISDRLKQGITEIIYIIEGLHQPWTNGLELFQHAQQNKHLLSTGCERVDTLLGGGLRKGHVTELVGPSSSGKTQICLHAASNVAKNCLGGVVFVNTGNAFSCKRIAQIVCQIHDPVDKKPNKILQQVMNGIVHHAVFDIFTLLDVLHQLESSLKSQTGEVHLLVVDSISSLITPILGGGSAHGHALMISTGFLLKKLAHEHSLSVLVTNHMVGGEGGVLKPALGESWKSVSHVRLHVSRDHVSNICTVCILSHPNKASGMGVDFMIS